MPERSLETMVDHLHRVAAERDDAATDGELLRRFLQTRDPSVFELIVWRHGAMVQAVCRRVLGGRGEADDAFQATFLVLLRYAHSIRKVESLAGWLHGVAFRVAHRALRTLTTRQRIERQASQPEAQLPAERDQPDLGSILHDEINRLPERLRQLFVLCEIEGRPKNEAASLLSLPYGTVLSRLSRARERLRRRLVQRGIAFGAAGVASTLAVEPVSAALVKSALQTTLHSSAATTIPGAASTLAKGVIQDMFARKLKTACAVILATSVVCIAGLTGVPRLLNIAHAGDNPEAAKPQPPAQLQQPPPALKDTDQSSQPSAFEQLIPTKPLHAYDPLEASLIGYWKLNIAVVNGEDRDPGETALAIGPFGKIYVVKGVGGGVQTPMTYQFHSRAGEQPAIDLIADGKTESGIFGFSQFESGEVQLRICLAAKGAKLPNSFSSTPGSNTTLLSFERVPNRSFDTKWADKMFEGGMTHDFGSVKYRDKPTYLFKFKNVYDRPIRVLNLSSDAQLGKQVGINRPGQPNIEYSNLHASAQTATREWIEPGQESTIEVRVECRQTLSQTPGGPTSGNIHVSFVVKGLDQLRATSSAEGNAADVFALDGGRRAGGAPNRRGPTGPNPQRNQAIGASTVVLTVSATDETLKQ